MAFVTNVTSVGELKFEVVTNNRTFIFRAESEGVCVCACVRVCVCMRVCVYSVLAQLYLCMHILINKFIHVVPPSREEQLGVCPAGLHQGAPPAQRRRELHHAVPGLPGIPGAPRAATQTLHRGGLG